MTPAEKKERNKAYQAKHRATGKPRAAWKRWAEAHPEDRRAMTAADRKRDKGARLRKWRELNPELDKARAHAQNLKRYGMTPEDYDRMLVTQNGVCAICRGVNPDGKRLAVDHNHMTKKVRGLLCRPCNLLIGLASEDSQRLRVSADYLERNR